MRPGSDQLGPELERERERGRHYSAVLPSDCLSASLFPEEISLTVPSTWQAEGEGVEEQDRGVCV